MTTEMNPYRSAMVEWAKELDSASAAIGPLMALEVRRRIKVVDQQVGRVEEEPRYPGTARAHQPADNRW